MKIMRIAEKISRLGKKTKEKQKYISVGEAYSLWTSLEIRYDTLITTKTLLRFVKDRDLRIIIEKGIETLEFQVKSIEELVKEHAIPMPNRPPADCNITVDKDAVTDQFIYREIYNGMSNMMFKHLSNYQRANSSILREAFRKYLNQEMDLYDQFYEYGKLKAYLVETPSFKS